MALTFDVINFIFLNERSHRLAKVVARDFYYAMELKWIVLIVIWYSIKWWEWYHIVVEYFHNLVFIKFLSLASISWVLGVWTSYFHLCLHISLSLLTMIQDYVRVYYGLFLRYFLIFASRNSMLFSSWLE